MSYTGKALILMNPERIWKESQDTVDAFLETWTKRHSEANDLRLFHYTTLDGVRGILNNRCIWFSHIGSLNDPGELHYGRDLLISMLDVFSKETENKRVHRLLDQLKSYLIVYDTFLYHTFIASFCEDENLLSQWRGYSNEGGGYNIGMSISDETKFIHDINNLDSDSYIVLRKVIYNLEDQKSLIGNFLFLLIARAETLDERIAKDIPEEKNNWSSHVALHAINILFDIMLTVKNPAFSEEKEWRMIKVMQKDAHPESVNFRPNQTNLYPYINTYIFEKEDEKVFPLRSITYGPSHDRSLARSAVELFLFNVSASKHQIQLKPHNVQIIDPGYILKNK